MHMGGCDQQSITNTLKNIVMEKYFKTWSHNEYYNCMIDDHLWFMTNAKIMHFEYEYNIYVIDYSKYDYDYEEETHPRVLEEKQKLKQEIDMFYHFILKTLS